VERKVHHNFETDRGLRAPMKAIRIHEHGGVGRLKLESQATMCWFELRMPVYSVNWKFQGSPPGAVPQPTVRQASW